MQLQVFQYEDILISEEPSFRCLLWYLFIVIGLFRTCQAKIMKCFAKILNDQISLRVLNTPFQANIYLFKVNNKNTRKRCKYVQS